MARGSALPELQAAFGVLMRSLKLGYPMFASTVEDPDDLESIVISDSAVFQDTISSVSQRIEVELYYGSQAFRLILVRTNKPRLRLGSDENTIIPIGDDD